MLLNEKKKHDSNASYHKERQRHVLFWFIISINKVQRITLLTYLKSDDQELNSKPMMSQAESVMEL